MVIPALNPQSIGPGGGRVYRLAGDLVTVKATAAESGGAYALFDARTAPAGGAPAHLQRYEDEAVYVLEGTYAARVGAETHELGPGAYAFVPRETVHAFTNRGHNLRADAGPRLTGRDPRALRHGSRYSGC